jgi:hypothetical protein
MAPLPARTALDTYFLEARCKLLDLAGILDRIGRGTGVGDAAADPRLAAIQRALEVLGRADGGRAERVQELFSLAYDPDWSRPEPRA